MQLQEFQPALTLLNKPPLSALPLGFEKARPGGWGMGAGKGPARLALGLQWRRVGRGLVGLLWGRRVGCRCRVCDTTNQGWQLVLRMRRYYIQAAMTATLVCPETE